MKQTITVYPYHPQHYPVVAAWDGLCEEYMLQAVVSDSGSGLCGKDAAYAIARENSGILVSSDVNTAIDQSDALMILSGDLSEPPHEGAVDAMRYAVSKGKKVFCAAKASDIQKSTLSCVSFLKEETGVAAVSSVELRQVYPITIPVIFVGSLFDQTDEDYVSLQLISRLKSKGVRVSGFGTDLCCHFLGLHTYPEYLLNGGITDTERIMQFNAFLHEIERKERPDVLVMQLPTALLRFNDFIINSFGIVPYLIAQSVVCDYFICCSANDRYNQEFWKNISKDFTYRYGHPIDVVHLSGSTINYMESLERRMLAYFRVGKLKLQMDTQQALNTDDMLVCDLTDNMQINAVLDDICGKFGL